MKRYLRIFSARAAMPPPANRRASTAGRAPGAAFTLIEIMIAVALIGLLTTISVPPLLRANRSAQRNTIRNNLRVIDQARTLVMANSNLAEYADLNKAMVDRHLDTGAIERLKWPGRPEYYLPALDNRYGDLDAWLGERRLALEIDLGEGPEIIAFPH